MPFASTSSVSFVEVSPSTETILKVSFTSSRSASWRSSLEIAASVVTNPSIVHMSGWIMPEPLHMPPTVTVFPSISNCTAASLDTVSVVIIASAAIRPASLPSDLVRASSSIPAVIFSTGICIPITPVEATSTASAGISSVSAAHSAVFLQQSYPAAPVHALAIPALMTTA